jgi:transposase
LSHTEWGDQAGVFAFLFETANASHGRLKGRPSAALITKGQDQYYVKAARLGRLFVPFDEKGIPLQGRVARHVAALQALLSSWAELYPLKPLEVQGWPSAEAVAAAGIGPFLHPPN